MSSLLAGRFRAEPHVFVPVAVAALVRGLNLAFLAANDPLFRHPVADSWFHYHEGKLILDTGFLLPGIGAFYKGPLYSYIAAILMALFGESGGVVAGRILSSALGCAAVYLVAELAARYAGRGAAWTAGLTAALYGTAVYLDAALLDVSLVATLLLGSALLLVRAEDEARPQRSLLAAGALLGLVSISRANGLLPLAVAVAYVGARGLPRGRAGLRWWQAAALVALPAALVIAPVTFRNAVLERDPVLISYNGGINLFMGNDPGFDQTSGNWTSDSTWARLYSAPGALGLARGADHQRFFVRQALGAALRAPLRAAGILAHKLAILFTGYEISNEERIYEAARHSPVLAALIPLGARLGLPFALVWPLLAAGIFLAALRRLPRIPPPLVLAAAWAAAPVLFFNTDRYRIAAILLCLPVGAAGLVRAWAERRDLARAAWAGAAVVAAFFLVLALATIPAHPMLPPSELFYRAQVAERQGRADGALALLHEAVAADPADPISRARLADRLLEQNRPAEALAQYQALHAQEKLAADWRLNAAHGVARALFRLGRFEESARWFHAFLDGNPDRPLTRGRPDFHLAGTPPLYDCGARIELADTYVELRRPDAAREQFRYVHEHCAEAAALVGLARSKEARLDAAGRPR